MLLIASIDSNSHILFIRLTVIALILFWNCALPVKPEYFHSQEHLRNINVIALMCQSKPQRQSTAKPSAKQ